MALSATNSYSANANGLILDTITIEVGPAITAEPASSVILALGLVGVVIVARKQES